MRLAACAAKEWMYAFDIHCNSFFPFFLVLYVAASAWILQIKYGAMGFLRHSTCLQVLHYLLLPLLSQSTWLAATFSLDADGTDGCSVVTYTVNTALPLAGWLR